MTPVAERAVDLFAEAGVIAYREGALTDALHELTVRIDLAGGGDLLAELARTCWATGQCETCGHEVRGTPNPHPKPPPPPPPPPPER